MKAEEFVTWMQGFVEACHEYAPTPKQWDALKDKLKEVDSLTPLRGILSDHNTFRVHETGTRWQEPHKINPYYIGDMPLTSTSFDLHGTGISTSLGYPSGSIVTYTTK